MIALEHIAGFEGFAGPVAAEADLIGADTTDAGEIIATSAEMAWDVARATTQALTADRIDRLDLESIFPFDPAMDYHAALDRVEVAMMQFPAALFRWEHRFTPGMYGRTIYMPAGSLLTSRIHKTEHQFVISAGSVSVLTDEGWRRFEAPYVGITKPGTRRLLFVHRDTVWSTFHVTDKTDPDEIVEDITDYRDAHLVGLVQPLPAGGKGLVL